MITNIENEYRVSERVVLRAGDRFRVSGGPYYRLSNGEKIAMAARGVMTFRRALRTGRGGRRVLIEASAGEGTVILHVEGSRRSPVDGLVARPYKITRKLREKTKG